MSEEATESVIAVVDDDGRIGRSLARFRKASGFQPVVSRSAEVILADQPHPQFDCSTVDLHLDDIAGIVLWDRLRSAGVNTPKIFLTAHDKQPDRLAVGAWCHLTAQERLRWGVTRLG